MYLQGPKQEGRLSTSLPYMMNIAFNTKWILRPVKEKLTLQKNVINVKNGGNVWMLS